MANNGKNSVTKAQAEAHRRVLQQLLRTEDNRRCADCLARGPTWASVNLGVFVCLNCSGIHRSLGTDLSKVRSTTLDTWLPEQVAFVQKMGNRKANLFWEGRGAGKLRRPAEGDMLGLRHFINDKYRDQRYALKTWDQPPTIETYAVHPFMLQFEGEAAEPQDSSCESSGAQPTPETAGRIATPASSDSIAIRRREQAGSGGLSTSDGGPSGGLRRIPSPAARQQPRQTSSVPPATQQLFDLLSLHEPESAPSPSVQDVLLPGTSHSPAPGPAARSGHRASASQESYADAASSDGGWAAFVEGSAPATAPSAEETWDAFQEGSPDPQEPAHDPFGAPENAAAPAVQNAAFQPKFPSAPSSPQQPPSPEQKGSHRPQKSAEEIMKMFDQPKQQENLFAAFPQASSGQTGGFTPVQPGFNAFPPPHLWPPFQMPVGAPGHGDLTFPPHLFGASNGFPTSMPPFPDPQGGWATLPPMSAPGFPQGSGSAGKGMR